MMQEMGSPKWLEYYIYGVLSFMVIIYYVIRTIYPVTSIAKGSRTLSKNVRDFLRTLFGKEYGEMERENKKWRDAYD